MAMLMRRKRQPSRLAMAARLAKADPVAEPDRSEA